MRVLVVFSGLLLAASAGPITPGYGLPAAPIEVVTVPEAPLPVVEPASVRASPLLPFAPGPARLLVRAPLVPAPAPRVVQAVAPAPLPLPAVAPAPAVIPRVASPLPLPAALPVPARSAVPAVVPLPAALPVPARAVPVALPVPLSAPSSQFHAQDELGGFSFGYENGNSRKNEVRTPDGITRGFYEYIDSNGLPQRVEYIADPVNGFRVAGSNIPVAGGIIADTPEVVAAKIQFQKAFDAALARNAVPVAVVDPVAADPAILPLAAVAKPIAVEAAPAKVALPLRKKRSAPVLTNGYGIPAAPLVPLAPAVPITPVSPVPAVRAVVPTPLLPTPLRLAHQAPLAPVARVAPLAPITPVAPIAPVAPVAPLAPVAPVAARATPFEAVINAPIVPEAPVSQYHAQDELGGISFGYANGNSARQEVRTPDGVTQGSYSYVDGYGITQTVNYIADALGFRVAATNLPVA